MRRFTHLRLLFLCLVFGTVFTFSAAAQRSAGSAGIGAQFGQPTGLTLKIYNPSGMSIDFLAAWDLSDFFFLNVHGLYERPLGSTDNLFYFVGPGAFIGVRDRGEFRDDDVALGISGTLGLSIVFGPVELFGQVTPRLELVERTDGDVGGGAGFRFYF